MNPPSWRKCNRQVGGNISLKEDFKDRDCERGAHTQGFAFETLADLSQKLLRKKLPKTKSYRAIANAALDALDGDAEKLSAAYSAFCADEYGKKDGWPLTRFLSQLGQYIPTEKRTTQPKPSEPTAVCKHEHTRQEHDRFQHATHTVCADCGALLDEAGHGVQSAAT